MVPLAVLTIALTAVAAAAAETTAKADREEDEDEEEAGGKQLSTTFKRSLVVCLSFDCIITRSLLLLLVK